MCEVLKVCFTLEEAACHLINVFSDVTVVALWVIGDQFFLEAVHWSYNTVDRILDN